MRKAWTYQRENRPGWYVGWYDNARNKHSKQCPNKSLVDAYARRKEHQLNEGIYPDPVKMPWGEIVEEYIDYKTSVRALASESLRSIQVTLGNFEALHGPIISTKMDQRLIDKFIAHRLKATAKATVNKDLRNLRAFVRWSIKNRYMGREARRIEWLMQKEPKRPVVALNEKQLGNLLIAARRYQRYGDAWFLRVLLAVSSGLRRGDLERLRLSDIDFENNTFKTYSQKTGKAMVNRPLHDEAVRALVHYREEMQPNQDRIFLDKFTSGKWESIRRNAGLPNLTFHDLRKTFASFLGQQGYSDGTAQGLLEHSTPKLTHDVYMDLSPKFKEAVNLLPVAQWL